MHTNAKTIDEAVSAHSTAGEFRAGGTDVQERIRAGNLALPLIDIQSIAGLNEIEFHESGVTIGALTTLNAVSNHAQLQKDYPAFTLPTQTLATPQIRNFATLGGSLCQRSRCWYYRHPELGCPKKGNSDTCGAREGNHERGVCFDFGPCVAPHPSSVGCALLTYDAQVEVTGRGRISVADLYGDGSVGGVAGRGSGDSSDVGGRYHIGCQSCHRCCCQYPFPVDRGRRTAHRQTG